MKILGHRTEEMTRLYSEHETQMKLNNAKEVLSQGWAILGAAQIYCSGKEFVTVGNKFFTFLVHCLIVLLSHNGLKTLWLFFCTFCEVQMPEETL